MSEQVGLGIMLALLGGAPSGSFASPMKRIPGWRWENTWLIYAVTGLIIIPWTVALATIPHLETVYQQASWSVLAKITLYEFAWGIGATLFGQGIARVGLALGFGVILGITSSFGSLLPLAVLHSEQLHTQHGLALMASTLVMIVGLVFLSIAGKRREREQNPDTAVSGSSGFVTGLIICVFSGIFSSMLNFAVIFGDEVRQHTLNAGANSAMAGNAIWSLAVTSGFIANAACCVYLLNKNHTCGIFTSQGIGGDYWLGGVLMGALWYGGVIVYGMGAATLGALGGIIGWPVFISMNIIAGISWGFINREWKGASRGSYGYCLVGIGILFFAIVIIARGNAN